MNYLAILLATASLAFGVSRLASIPIVAVLVTSGLILKSFVSLPKEILENAMELGLSFLLFSMGIELSPERFINRFKTVFTIAIVQIFVVSILAYLLAINIGYNHNTAILLSLAIASSSTVAIIRHVRKQGQLYEPFGRLVTGVLLVQDLLVILALVYWQQWERGKDLLLTTYPLVGLLIFSYLSHRYFLPTVILYYQEKSEFLLLLSLSILFLFMGFSYFLEIPYLTGAFLAGFALSNFPVNGFVRSQLTSITDFFLAIFFISVGAYIEIPSVKGFLTIALFLFLLFTVTPIVVTITAEHFHISTRSSLETGLLLAQAGELSLAAGLFAFTHSQIDREIFSIIALVTVISMAITPILAVDSTTFFLMEKRIRLRLKTKQMNLKNHIVIIGYGTVTRRLKEEILTLKKPVIIIDDDPRVVADLQDKRFIAIAGDIRDRRVLQAVKIKDAYFVLSFARNLKDSLYLLHLLKNTQVKVVVRVFNKKAEELVKKEGGFAINASETAIKQFMSWFTKNFS